MPVFRLNANPALFPDPALAEGDGLLAVGGDLSPARLLAAYQRGIFPWYSQGSPPLWWSPDPRCVLFPHEFHLPCSLRRTLQKNTFTFTVDTAFAQVIQACAAPRQGADGTWLVPEMQRAYTHLHTLGLAHSIEAWHQGKLAGGLYGLFLGRVFFGESMFHHVPNASKAAFAYLVGILEKKHCSLIDCQQTTANLVRFGARPIARQEFMEHLRAGLTATTYAQPWNTNNAD